jgi:hypothetical protein
MVVVKHIFNCVCSNQSFPEELAPSGGLFGEAIPLGRDKPT